ncbi:DnaJ subfamily C member 27 [Tetrabaena socialis]|uniref:DnaJ subfamily C member 27 n=1 Tax=Tetrabaena socialis TaxID=47790 RepID=A0A2J7ZY14_9CHLO|nr:DnaJ subfamily C member 27 [Tetrabaena socialis]|eukprot:PNH05156.1 DnaJ subfamily C member 27 [Tetrabaena socialis]
MMPISDERALLGALLAAILCVCSCLYLWAKSSERTCGELARAKHQLQVELDTARSHAVQQQAELIVSFDAVLEKRDAALRALQDQVAAKEAARSLLEQNLGRTSRLARRAGLLPSAAPTPATAGRGGSASSVSPDPANTPRAGAKAATAGAGAPCPALFRGFGAAAARASAPAAPATPAPRNTTSCAFGSPTVEGGEAASACGQPELWPEALQQANIQLIRLAEEGDELRQQLEVRGREAEERQEELRDAQAQLSFLHEECEALRSRCAEAQRQHDDTALALRQREAQLETARVAAVEAARRGDLAAAQAAATAAAAARRAELAAAAQSEALRGALAGALSDLRAAREREEAGSAERVAAAAGAAAARRALEAAELAVRAELQEARTRLGDTVRRLAEQQAGAKTEATALKGRIDALEAADAARKEAKRKEDAQRVQHILQSAGAPYKMLRLQLDCSAEEVKKAYRSLALQLHPDKCGAEGAGEAFGLATAARDSLLERCEALQRAKSSRAAAGASAFGAAASARWKAKG